MEKSLRGPRLTADNRVDGPWDTMVWLRRPAARAFIGLAALLLIAAIIAPRTLKPESLASMTPFIAILGVAAIAQHLVIQQRGFDLSVAGAMSLAAVVVTALPPTDAGTGSTAAFVALALGIGALGGCLNGVVVNALGVPSLVTTIGVNAVLLGFVLYVSAGAIHAAPAPLAAIASDRVGPISVLFFVFLGILVLTAWIIARTSVGRRFIASAVNPAAARALGVSVERFSIGTYAVSGFLFALAGVMLAGLSVTPTVLSGNAYMLTTVAAVIIGGSPLNGDRGSVVATGLGAIFLVFLDQLVVSLGFAYAIQSIVEAGIILIGVTAPELVRRLHGRKGTQPTAVLATAPLRERVASSEGSQLLELVGLSKTFEGTHALKGVDLSVIAGEVHAIVGENGAGKSTLIAVAAGVLPASTGQVWITGNLIETPDPISMRAAGVSVAFQHPATPPHLSVIECIRLVSSEFAGSNGFERAQALIDRVASGSLRVAPGDRVAELSIGQRHVVEIVRALAPNPKVLVLDEPTEPFKDDEVAQLFHHIRMLKSKGVGVIYISHRLHEVEEIADRISVLRDGELVATRPLGEFHHKEIIGMIVGRPLGHVFPEKAGAPGPPVLQVEDLSGERFHGVCFEARHGEIVGLAGVEGQGQRELIRAMAGLEPFSGSIRVAGTSADFASRRLARASGVGFVPDDRHLEGLFMSLSVEENLGNGRLRDGVFVVDRSEERRVCASVICELGVKASSPAAPLSTLSGGNQQKVLIGREIAANPRVLFVDEPTKGVDIGSKGEIYRKLRELADSGVAVIMASSDGVELEGLCDRVLVMSQGAITREFVGAAVSDEQITAANLTATERRGKFGPAAKTSALHALLGAEELPALVLVLLTCGVFYSAVSVNAHFLSAYNLINVQTQFATLALVSFAQLFVITTGEIDFSVGPLAGFVVVLASYWMPDGASTATVAAGSLAIVVLTTLIGLAQGLIIVALDLPSIVVTLVSFFALQGLSLSLRPLPGGPISGDLVGVLLGSWGYLAFATLVVVGLAGALEFVLSRTGFGTSLRAVGSDRDAAHKLGVKRARMVSLTFAADGALAGAAGLLLAATVGVGSGTAGVNFTLMSITAVVLGGAVITGGCGSFVSTLFGALLVQATMSATSFLQIGVGSQYWFVGAITLAAAGLFSISRRGALRFA